MVWYVGILYIYYHAHFLASSLKIDWICHFSDIWFGLVWFSLVFVWHGLWVLSQHTTMQNFKVLAWKLTDLWQILVIFGLVWYGLVWFGLIWFCMVWYVGINQTYYHAKFQGSSLKIDWVMAILVIFGLVWFGFVWHGMWVLSRHTTIRNF